MYILQEALPCPARAFLFGLIVAVYLMMMTGFTTGMALSDPVILRGNEDLTGGRPLSLPVAISTSAQATLSQSPVPAPPAVAASIGSMAANHVKLHGDRFGRPVAKGRMHLEDHPIMAVRTPERRTYFQEHPKMRAALLYAGVGTAAGAVTGLVTHRGVFRGAAIGAGTGVGIGLIRSNDTLKRHPIIKDLATGAVGGLGLGMASSHHLGKPGELAAVGAALGLGVGVVKDGLK